MQPVLFDGGGLREIVHLLGLSPQKHLFSTIDELVAKTEALVTDHTPLDPETHKKLNLTMSREAFEKRFLNLISS
jgi:hypothetical protein